MSPWKFYATFSLVFGQGRGRTEGQELKSGGAEGPGTRVGAKRQAGRFCFFYSEEEDFGLAFCQGIHVSEKWQRGILRA